MRLDPRIQVRAAIDARIRDAPHRRLILETIDLCASGALCRSPRPVAPDAIVRGRLILAPVESDDLVTIPIQAVILRQEPDGAEHRLALHFLELSEEARRSIRRFVFAHLHRPSAEPS